MANLEAWSPLPPAMPHPDCLSAVHRLIRLVRL
jgi:hypothetical protein